jgi:alkylhydroperoxidase family enzyme
VVRPIEEDLRTVKAAGYDDGQIVEIIEHVALNVFTNYINETLKTEIDHPAVSFRKAS